MAKYSKYLEDMIMESERKVEAMNGFETPQVAEPVDVRRFNNFADPWNPLFNSEEYAAKTRFGTIPAFPSFFEWMCDSVHLPNIAPEGGFSFGMYAGESFELFQPVIPGRTYKVFHKPSKLQDITVMVEDIPQNYLMWPKHLPIFSWMEQDLDVFDDEDHLVASFKHMNDVTIYEDALDNEKIAESLPYKKHYYTNEEWAYINSIIAGEKIRGAEVRYWEDVEIGEDITPTTIGPTTIWDMISHLASCAMPRETPFHPLRRQRELFGALPIDEETNNYKHFIGMHVWDAELAKRGGMPGPFHFGNYGRNCLMRMITNWMGDDGDIRKFNWRHMKMTPIGDCQIAHGRVVNKMVVNGEPLVEIDMWLENVCLGNITEAGRCLVKLKSRENLPDNVTPQSAALEKQFRPGTCAKVKNRKERMLPSGDPLAGMEVEVIAATSPWQLVFLDFDGYVPVRVIDPVKKFALGATLILREEDLERI